MKRFLIGTSIGGAQITKRAWDYLVGNQEEKYSDIWNKYFSMCFGGKNDDDDFIRFNFYSPDALEFREIVLRLVEDLNYDYTELDKLNGDSLLRIVEVPNDGHEYCVREDGETGSEYVSPVHRIYMPAQDWYMRAKYLIRVINCEISKFELNDGVIDVFTLSGIKVVRDNKYAIAQCKDDTGSDVFFLMQKREYYAGNDEHPKISYDILNESNTASYFGMQSDVLSMDAMDSFHKLYKKLKSEG